MISVLQNFKKVETDPWPHIMIKNALPQNIHDELLSTLPDKRLTQGQPKDKHGKLTWKAYEIAPEQYPEIPAPAYFRGRPLWQTMWQLLKGPD